MLRQRRPEQFQKVIDEASPEQIAAYNKHWPHWARVEQLPPEGNWQIWLFLGGRGTGKTRAGAEWVRSQVEQGCSRIAVVAPTASDVRDVMVEGESGILKISPPWYRPSYEPSKRKLTWPDGQIALCYSADEPDRLRGPQFEKSWCFIAGTMVRTKYGERSIESLCIGDSVSTRSGSAKVQAISSRIADVGKVGLSNGQNLVGTREHPIMSIDGWVKLYKLKQGQRLWSGKKPDRVISPLIHKEKQSFNTDGFGKSISALSRLAIRFITRMGTKGTTQSRIFRYSLTACIGDCITNFLLLPVRRIQKLMLWPVQIAEGLLQEGSSRPLFATPAHASVLTERERPREIADNVGKNSFQSTEATVLSVVSTWEDAGRQRVYNLKVESEPEYFANGVLVHNCDEIGYWRYPETWDNILMCTRLAQNPQHCVTTTPKRTKLVKGLFSDSTCKVTRGSTYRNIANLPHSWIERIIKRYEGTALGRQELNAELLDEVDGALWKLSEIDEHRLDKIPCELVRVVVALDPSVTNTEESDECGIIIGGIGTDGHGYILDDESARISPDGWARIACGAYHRRQADRIIGEANNGGDLIELTIRTVDKDVSYKKVTASRGKLTRAEPIAALYEQGRVHHVGTFPLLEDEMTSWVPGDKSPNRMDALVWAMSELMVRDEVRILASW